MAYKINEDLYIGNTNKQLKDLLVSDGDTLPIGAIVDFDGSTIPDGYARYVDPDVMSETILFDTNIWDSMMKRYETKNIDFTPYTYVEVHFTGQGGTNATNTILKIDLTKPFESVITNSSVSYSYGASVCFPDIQLLQGSNNDPGIFRIGACISTDKKKIWMGDPGYFTGQTNSGNFDANSVYNRISKIVGFKPTIRIKKIQQPASYPENSIHDAYSTSTTDTYSCNYINSIVESGSNTNGDYIKYSDGTMICTKKVSFVGLQFTTAWGNAYETPPVDLGDYAQEFVDIPLMFVSCAYSTAAAEGLANTETSYGSVIFYRPIRTDAADYSYTFYLMAIGKWK